VQAVILAAGRGKRLHPVTANRTKAMAPILGKPIVERVMDTLVANGVHDFVLVTSPDDTEIVDYFTCKSKIGAEVVLVPQPQPLGMGHALLQAAPYIHGDFVLSSCDNIVTEDEVGRMLNYWQRNHLNGILTLLQVGPEEIVRMGIVEWDGKQIIRIVEKPSLERAPSNLGSVPLYMFSHRLLEYLPGIKPSPRGELELQDAMQPLIEVDSAVHGLMLKDRIDLTLPEDLLRLNIHYLNMGSPQIKIDQNIIGRDTEIIAPVYFDPEVSIGENCAIGPNVYLEQGCKIGNNVKLESVVVLRGREVHAGTVKTNDVIW
jgi:NDP-sugar pyrophosphorylase family protein